LSVLPKMTSMRFLTAVDGWFLIWLLFRSVLDFVNSFYFDPYCPYKSKSQTSSSVAHVPWILFSVTDSDIAAKSYCRWKRLNVNCLGRGAYASREIERHWPKKSLSVQSRRKHNQQNTGKR
jgi:hypothetical protein